MNLDFLCYVACTVACEVDSNQTSTNKDILTILKHQECDKIIEKFEINSFTTFSELNMVIFTCAYNVNNKVRIVAFSGPVKALFNKWSDFFAPEEKYRGIKFLMTQINLSYFKGIMDSHPKDLIMFTGYSLGGTLANLCALSLGRENCHCVTFGSPSIIVESFKQEEMDKSTFRCYIQKNDPVPLCTSISISNPSKPSYNFLYASSYKLFISSLSKFIVEKSFLGLPEKNSEGIFFLGRYRETSIRLDYDYLMQKMLIGIHVSIPDLSSYKSIVPKLPAFPGVASIQVSTAYKDASAPSISDTGVFWLQNTKTTKGEIEIICTGSNLLNINPKGIHIRQTFQTVEKENQIITYPVKTISEQSVVRLTAQFEQKELDDGQSEVTLLYSPFYPVLPLSNMDIVAESENVAKTQSNIADPLKIFTFSFVRWLLLEQFSNDTTHIQNDIETNLLQLQDVLTTEDDFSLDPKDLESITSARNMARSQFASDSPVVSLREIFKKYSKNDITEAMRSAAPVLCLMIFRLNHFGSPIKVKNINADRNKVLAGIGFGAAVTLSVAAAVAISVVSLGILAPVGTGLVATEIGLLIGTGVVATSSVAAALSGVYLLNMLVDQYKANYKKKLRLIIHGNELSHQCEMDENLELEISNRFVDCQREFREREKGYSPLEKIFNPQEKILLKSFPNIVYTEHLWNYLAAVCHIHHLRRLITLVYIGGVIGAHNSGKSSFLKSAFGFQTNPGLVSEKRTQVPTPFYVPFIENVVVVDFPGSDEIVINKQQIRFMMEACNCWIIMCTYESGLTDHIFELLGVSKRRRIPCLMCLNKSDVVWADCRRKKRKECKGKSLSKEEMQKEVAVYFVQQTKEMENDYKKKAPTTEMWFTCFKKKAMESIILPDNQNFIKDVDAVKRWLAGNLIPTKIEELMKVKLECSSSESDDSD